MTRTQLKRLAEERLRDADALLAAGRWSAAYYLAGYSVECGLKACIARLTKVHEYPNKDLANKCYTHKIEILVELAGVKNQRDADGIVNSLLGSSWLIVKDWDEKSRYEFWTPSQARKLFSAVSDPVNGVLPWIKARW